MDKLPNPQKTNTSTQTGHSRFGVIILMTIAIGLIIILFLLVRQQSLTIQELSATTTIEPTIVATLHPLESLIPTLEESVVRITAKRRGDFSVSENGTGFIISDDGLIVTNAHVVMNGDIQGQITVNLTVNNQELERNAVIKGIIPCDDIALIDMEGKYYTPVPSNSTITLALGAEIFLLGYGHGTLNTPNSIRFAQGTISRTQTSFSSFPILIEHSVPLLPADSGSPLFDLTGQLIGMNFAMDTQIRGSISYAIDYQRIRTILPLLIEQKAPATNYTLDIIHSDTSSITPTIRQLSDYFDRHCHTVNLESGKNLIIQAIPQDSNLFRPIISVYDSYNQLQTIPTELTLDNNYTINSQITVGGRYTVVIGRNTVNTGVGKLGDYILTISQET